MDPWLFLPLCPEDLEAVVAIESQSFEQPWQRQALEGEARRPGALAFVLKPLQGAAQSEVAAYIFLRLLSDEVHIIKLAVAPELRRRGLARRLVAKSLAVARREGVTRAALEVRPSNTAAIEFYTCMGFHEVGTRKRYYGPAGEDALVMAQNLKEVA